MFAHHTISVNKPFELDKLPYNKKLRVFLEVPGNALGTPWQIPIIVIRGKEDGPVFGITSAVHGNDRNGILSIFKLADSIKPKDLKDLQIFLKILLIYS